MTATGSVLSFGAARQSRCLEFNNPALYGSGIELGTAPGGLHKRFLIVIERQFALLQMVERHRQVVPIIGVSRLKAISLEIGLLRLAPAPVPGVQIAQGKLQGCGIRSFGDEGLQFGFHGLRVDRSAYREYPR